MCQPHETLTTAIVIGLVGSLVVFLMQVYFFPLKSKTTGKGPSL